MYAYRDSKELWTACVVVDPGFYWPNPDQYGSLFGSMKNIFILRINIIEIFLLNHNCCQKKIEHRFIYILGWWTGFDHLQKVGSKSGPRDPDPQPWYAYINSLSFVYHSRSVGCQNSDSDDSGTLINTFTARVADPVVNKNLIRFFKGYSPNAVISPRVPKNQAWIQNTNIVLKLVLHFYLPKL